VDNAPHKIVLTGSRGLLGSALARQWSADGITVLRLVRDKPRDPEREVYWDYEHQILDAARLEGVDAVVHLGGESIAARRWRPAVKARIRDSRVKSTQFLAQVLAELSDPPAVFAVASAVGYYGSREDELLTEESGLGEGFLTDVCAAWEAATGAARRSGLRTVNLRLGMVLSAEGGALARMLLPFRWGLGGRVGSGRQWQSWIALPDAVAAIDHVLRSGVVSGPVNVVSPQPVTNAEFTQALAAALHRRAWLPLPALAVNLLFGELGRELLLGSTRVAPKVLEFSGFRFQYPELSAALRGVLQAPAEAQP